MFTALRKINHKIPTASWNNSRKPYLIKNGVSSADLHIFVTSEIPVDKIPENSSVNLQSRLGINSLLLSNLGIPSENGVQTEPIFKARDWLK